MGIQIGQKGFCLLTVSKKDSFMMYDNLLPCLQIIPAELQISAFPP